MSKTRKKHSVDINRVHPQLRRQGFLNRTGTGEIMALNWNQQGLWVASRAGLWHWSEPLEGAVTQQLWTPISGVVWDQQGLIYTYAAQIDCWNADLALQTSFSPHQGHIVALAVSPDGQFLVSLGEDSKLIVCDHHGQQLRQLSIPANSNGLRVDWESGKAWTATAEGAQQWDLNSGIGLQQGREIAALLLADNGWTGDAQGRVFCQGQIFEQLQEPLVAWAFAPDQPLLALASQQELLLVDSQSSELQRSWDDFQEWPACLAVAPNGRLVVSGSLDGCLSLRKLDNHQLKKKQAAHADAVTVLAFSGDKQWLFSGGADGVLCRWSWPDLEFQQNLDGHDGPIHSLLFERERLFSGGCDGQIVVWDYLSGLNLASFTGYDSAVEQLHIAQGGEVLLALYADGNWISWDITPFF